MKSRPIIQLLALSPVLFIPALVLMLSTLIVDAEILNHDKNIIQIESDYQETEKARIRAKVNNVVDLIEYRHSVIKQKLHDRIQRRVENAQNIALALHARYQDTLPEKALKELIIAALRPLEWNNGESYIWVMGFDGVLQLGPAYLEGSEGESLLEFVDVDGRKIIQEEIAIVKDQGHGFLWNTFTKLGEPEHKQFKQLAYVKTLGVYNWYIGSAEFLDTASSLSKPQLLETINQVGKGDSDYTFVLDSDGNLLLNFARPDIVGRNMSETEDQSLHGLYQMIVRSGQSTNPEFIRYNWLNPQTGLVEPKMTYVKAVPNSNWVVGSGFYPSVLQRGYEAQKNRLKAQHQEKIQHFSDLTWLSVMGSLIIAAFISAMFYRALTQFREGLVENNDELKHHNIDLENEIIKAKQQLNKAKQKVEELLTVDEVTFLANKEYVLKRLQYEVERAQRYKSPLSVMLFEITDWETIMDQLDVSELEQFLKEFATELRYQLRNVDFVGRLNEHDFLIILPATSIDQAAMTGTRIHQVLTQKEFVKQDLAKATLTSGVVEFASGQNSSELLSRVEKALLKAKKQGPGSLFRIE